MGYKPPVPIRIPYTLMHDIGLKGNNATTITINTVTLIILCNIDIISMLIYRPCAPGDVTQWPVLTMCRER